MSIWLVIIVQRDSVHSVIYRVKVLIQSRNEPEGVGGE